jgi:hypothetical protein
MRGPFFQIPTPLVVDLRRSHVPVGPINRRMVAEAEEVLRDADLRTALALDSGDDLGLEIVHSAAAVLCLVEVQPEFEVDQQSLDEPVGSGGHHTEFFEPPSIIRYGVPGT